MVSLSSEMGSHGSVEAISGEQDAATFKLVGEIDISNAEDVSARLDGMIAAAAPSRLVLDLADLQFMDSSGIAILLRAAGRASSVSIRNPSHVVRRVIECTGLSDVLRLEP